MGTRLMVKRSGMMLVMVWLGLLAAGCEYQPVLGEYRFLQADKPIAKPDQAQVNWIIQDMGELDKSDDVYPHSTKPSPQDLIYVDEDYVIGPMDELNISIMDLYVEGVETPLQRRVSDSGYIDLPSLEGKIEAAGLTGLELTERIKTEYSKNILLEPQVSIAVVGRRQQTFSILGAVGNPGTFPFPRKDMRLLDAIAMGRGVVQPEIETIYVIRQAPALRKSQTELLQPATQPIGTSKISNRAVPNPSHRFMASASSRRPFANQGSIYQMTETAQALKSAPTSAPALAEPAAPAETAQDESEYRWIYKNGEWVRVEKSGSTPAVKQLPTPTSQPDAISTPLIKPVQPTSPVIETPKDPGDPFDWAKTEKGDLVRIIAIDLAKLRQGNPRQNVVIRSGDHIQVPPLPTGVFYISGEVFRPGVYNLTNQKITIKMALAAAGNLGPLAWPSNAILTRRIGKNQEQRFPINIERIMRGKDNDIYLKKDDILEVGTHWSTSFLAVLRNAFRMTYGFGFIYDRNFSDPMFTTPTSRRFKAL